MSAHIIPFNGISAPRAAARAPDLRSWARAMLQARQTRTMLGQMDDHMLADIGLSRAEAQAEASRPFWDLASKRQA